MEKIIAALWDVDNANLLARLPDALRATGASGIRLNLRDAEVEPAAALIQSWQTPQQQAIAQLWLPSASPHKRGDAFAALAAHCGHFHAWLVAESTIIPNTAHPPVPGMRTWGWSQASFISFRPDLSHAQAVGIWHDHHTRVAIDTQANFEYVQNLIVLPLTEGAPGYGAFVEECFPAEAMTDPHAFYDAQGDAAKFKANLDVMMDSCGRFIDFSRIDIIPTSQFDFGGQ